MTERQRADDRFHVLFARHHRDIQAYCVRRLSLHDANEAAADVFVVVWRRIDELPPDHEIVPWLYGIARNVVRNHRRSAVRRLRLVAKAGSLATETHDGPEVQMVRHADHVELVHAMNQLKDDDQELLRLKSWEQLSNRQIAATLQISEQAVESRYARALGRLAKRLPNHKQRFRIRPLPAQREEEAI